MKAAPAGPGRFGPVMQMGYVVPDLDAALARWTGVMGVGPFFVADVPMDGTQFRGSPVSGAMRVALAVHGGMQVELIQQVSGGRTAFTDFLDRRGGGLHHVCALTDDLDRDLAVWAARGVGVLQGGRTAAGVAFAYLDTDPDDAGGVLELVQPTPGLTRFFARITAAADGWDGTNPRIDL
jgi:catechol 2,3-dioxygenase-like lactoylglutathione lyase family enzyme